MAIAQAVIDNLKASQICVAKPSLQAVSDSAVFVP